MKLRARGAALDALVTQIIANDENFPFNASVSDVAAYKRRIRRIAAKALLAREDEEQRADMTAEQFDQRQSAARASSFATAVLAQAQKLLSEPDDPEALDEIDYDADFPEDDQAQNAENAEGDLEDRAMQSNLTDATLNGSVRMMFDNNETGTGMNDFALDVHGTGNTPLEDIPWPALASSFMMVILDNSLSAFMTWKDETDMRCPICVEDETVELESKVKQWQSAPTAVTTWIRFFIQARQPSSAVSR